MGVTSGDIGSGLRQGSELLRSELAMRAKLVEALSYPAFILVSSLGALLIILVYVIPSLEPLVAMQGAEPPLIMAGLLALSGFIRAWGSGLAIALALGLAALIGLSRMGVLGPWADRLVLDGPARRLTSSFVYGRFAQVLGRLQSAGVPLAEALRLAGEALGSELAHNRLEAAARRVRQGEPLSGALESVNGFPGQIRRLIVIGERTGELGSMLDRAGTLELETLVRRIDRLAKVLGPALIVLLGAIIGMMMGGLLSGVSTLGEAL